MRSAAIIANRALQKAVWEAARKSRIRVLLDGSSVQEDGIDAAGGAEAAGYDCREPSHQGGYP